MGDVEGIEEGVLISQAEVVLDVVMEVTGDGTAGVFVIALERDEIIALLVEDLPDDGSLASHGAGRHDATLDGQELQEFRNGGDFIGLAVCLELAHDESAVLRAPS